MKLIDEKGRLFGVVNLIDFFVLLFLLAMVPAFYFGYKIIFKKPTVQESFEKGIKEIKLSCEFIKLRPDIAGLIFVGDAEFDNKGRIIGEIVELGPIEPDKEDPQLKTRSTVLKLKAQFREADLYYKGSVIDYDSEFVFKTSKYSASAKVEEDITRIFSMRVTLKDLDENIIGLISVGDKEVDAAGQVVAEITKVGKPEENSKEIDLTSGNFTIVSDKEKKQLPVELALKCQLINVDGQQQLYFKDKRITNITPIEIVTDKYRVLGLLSKSYEIIPERNFRWLSLKVKFSNVIPQIRDALKEGEVEKDFYGAPMARIVKITNDEPAKTMVIREGKVEELLLPYQRELLIALDVFCEEREGVYYFKNYPVKMGNSITFSTSLYSINGLIIGIEIR